MKNDLPGNLNLRRLEALTDGVFAIAMTLLVLTIDIPDKDLNLSGEALHQVLLSQLNQLSTYVISFVLLAMFWIINNRQLIYLKSTTHKHIWINVGTLVFICLVPFTTSLKGDFPDDWMASLYFNLNMLIIAVLYLFHWNYAFGSKKLAKENIGDVIFSRGKQNTIAFIVVSVIAVGLSFVIADESAYVYLLVPLTKFFIRKKK